VTCAGELRRRRCNSCQRAFFFLISGDTAPVRHLSLKSLLPETDGYMTYEGSTTHPGCWETAIWLILNKPIYITAREVNIDPSLPMICCPALHPLVVPPLLFLFSSLYPSLFHPSRFRAGWRARVSRNHNRIAESSDRSDKTSRQTASSILSTVRLTNRYSHSVIISVVSAVRPKEINAGSGKHPESTSR